MTKEEILTSYPVGFRTINQMENICAAMQQYADQQTAELRAQLSDLKSKHEFTETVFNSLKIDNLNLCAEIERLNEQISLYKLYVKVDNHYQNNKP